MKPQNCQRLELFSTYARTCRSGSDLINPQLIIQFTPVGLFTDLPYTPRSNVVSYYCAQKSALIPFSAQFYHTVSLLNMVAIRLNL